ncbi:unnamed protein product [Ectocarpus sp. CCAP 1310/34]|nr:unnamed protein product [Ectocarpus sp. CCAP 1310/34]
MTWPLAGCEATHQTTGATGVCSTLDLHGLILTALQTAAACPASFLFHAYHGVFVQTALQTASML